MGANVTIDCPVESCEYSAGFRLGMGEETAPGAWLERQNILAEEHPDHPSDDDNEPTAPAKKTITDL